MLLLALACAAPTPSAAGEIRLASDGAVYETLGDALIAAEAEDAITVGPGTYSLADARDCGDLNFVADRAITITGAGSAQTRLVGTNAAHLAGCDDLRFPFSGEDSAIALTGLTLEDASVHLYAADVALRDLVFTGYTAYDRHMFRVEADTLSLRDVTLTDNELLYGAGFKLRGDGEYTNFSVLNSATATGYLGEIYGPVTWTGGQVSGVSRSEDSEGFDVLETWNAVTIREVTFSGGHANGPMLTDHGALTLEEVRFEGNDVTWRGALSSEGATVMRGGGFFNNSAPVGAVTLWARGTAQFHGVDFGANTPCAIANEEGCIAENPGQNATLICDSSGCR